MALVSKIRKLCLSRFEFYWTCMYLTMFAFQIFYYAGGKGFPGTSQFKDRIEWAGDLNKKDGSIRVSNMQFADNGTYVCD
ncbi:myelin protein zero-like protein 1 isoform X3, partial [Clarias magur]